MAGAFKITLLLNAAVIAAVFLQEVQGMPMLPCNSPLRLSFPTLFTHCTGVCNYTDWSDWEMVPNSVVDVTNCSSGQAYRENRTQTAFRCEDKTETKLICLPPQAERLIVALGLGPTSGGQPGPPVPPGQPRPPGSPGSPGQPVFAPLVVYRHPWCPVETNGVGQQICHRITEPRGKRETGVDGAGGSKGETKVPREAEVHHNAVEFDWHEHGRRFRRQTSCYTDSNDPKYILFILDKSGSVGYTNFEKMKRAISELIPLFCGSIRVAVMTFDHEYFLEFCFDCFGSDISDREDAQEAIMSIVYGDGGWTHTGGAARCACHHVLNERCGLPDDASCIDVVFITDGQSNDPTRDICVEIDCIKTLPGVTTHAIGIGLGRDDQDELNCIKHATNAFNYAGLDAFVQGIEDVKTNIREGLNESLILGCASQNTAYNPRG